MDKYTLEVLLFSFLSLHFWQVMVRSTFTITKGRLVFFVVKLFLIINVANNRIFLSIIENKQQETIFANFLSHFVDYRSANLRIIIALGMSVCSVIIQAQWGKFVFLHPNDFTRYFLNFKSLIL